MCNHAVFYWNELYTVDMDAWGTYIYLANLKLRLWEGHVEDESKCDHKQYGEDDHLQKRTDNSSEHNDVDAYAGKFRTKSYQVNPCQ